MSKKFLSLLQPIVWSNDHFQTLRPRVMGSWATQGSEGNKGNTGKRDWHSLVRFSYMASKSYWLGKKSLGGSSQRMPPFLSAAKDSNLIRFTPLVELFTRESTPTLTLTRRSLTTQNSARQTLRSWSERRCVAKLIKLKFFQLDFPSKGCTDAYVCGIATDVCVGRSHKQALKCLVG